MRSVLVTGASRGIGRAVASELHAHGWHVVATARRPGDLAGVDADVRLRLDVTDPASIAAAAAAAGPVDAVVNNAGVALRGPLEAATADDVRLVLGVNVAGAIAVTQAFLPSMRARRSGTVLFMSSVLGRVALAQASVYVASKFAIEGLAQSLRAEVAGSGVRVVVLNPGLVDTGALEASPVRTAPGYPEPPALPDATPVAEVAAAAREALEDEDGPDAVPVGSLARYLLAPSG